ncbi:MAG: FAD-dependent oxidoreductase, partial [Chloroflexota bacterium]|nr:FAD-dependent oxidoreductase [Chloroflexota bacterium]
MTETSKLFQPGRIGNLEIMNRIAMAPMLPFGLLEMDGSVAQRCIDYYEARAKGQVGLIITGAFIPCLDIEMKGMKDSGVTPLPRADVKHVIPRMKMLADAVHAYGSKIAIQLTCGTGRVAFPLILQFMGSKPVAPSVVPYVWDTNVMTRALEVEEIETLIRSFGEAAEILKSAGIDAIELHGHEGYLMDQFMTSLWNKRTDKYGGDLEGRLTFPLEILKQIKDRAGKDYPVIYRYAADHYIEGGRRIAESQEMAKRFEQAGMDALHVDAGCYDDWYWPHPPNYQPPGCMIDMAEAIKKVVNIPVITVGRLGYPDLAEQVLQEGKADFIALGRPLLADADWPVKAQKGEVIEIRPCIGDHDGCMGAAGGFISCTVNPACGKEKEYEIKPAETKKSVLVIGGGVAGMEAATVAALRGHDVTLCEKTSTLGGHLVAGSVPKFKDDLRLLREYYAHQLEKLNVKVNLNKEVTLGFVEDMKPNVAIVAAGSYPCIPNIPGIDKGSVVTAIDALLGRKEVGDRVLVAGGGLVGCETALHLAQMGKRVTITEMMEEIIPDVFEANKQHLLKLLAENGVGV